MTNLNRIFFWDPCLSPHKTDLLNQIKNDFKYRNNFGIAYRFSR